MADVDETTALPGEMEPLDEVAAHADPTAAPSDDLGAPADEGKVTLPAAPRRRDVFRLPCMVWNARKEDWRPVRPLYAVDQPRLKVVTYNVWFQPFHRERRNAAILSLLEKCDADVICLQEVLVDVVQLLTATAWVRARYWLSDAEGFTLGQYGVLMLGRIAFGTPLLDLYRLPSMMGRSLLRARFRTEAGDEMAVATVHLESLNNAKMRRIQLQAANLVLKSYPTALLTGDFNFDATRNFKDARGPLENDVLTEKLPDFADVWSTARPGEPGHTYDTRRNLMLPPKNEHMRYDRIMFRSDKRVIAGVELIGVDELPPEPKPEARDIARDDGWQLAPAARRKQRKQEQRVQQQWRRDAADRVWPSDHFGVVAEFVLRE